MCNLVNDLRPDIIIGNETWLTPEVNNSELGLNDFDIFRRDRETKKGGGVLIAVKRDLCCEQHHFSKDAELIFCKVNLKGRKPLVIGSAYRPPNLDFEDSKSAQAFQSSG